MLFISSENGHVHGGVCRLLQRLAENVSFALGNFDRADEKAKTEEQKERLTGMFAALSATNEAIMRAKSANGAVRTGLRGRGARRHVHLHDHRAGEARQRFHGNRRRRRSDRRTRAARCTLSIDAASASRRARCLRHSFRTGHPASSTIFLPIGGPGIPRARPARADPIGRSFPLLCEAQASASCCFSPANGAFTAELVELLQRLADNVSFALETFDRADEKARTEEQKERLTRMFAALSATNEAIVRAKTRAELFELVCQATAAAASLPPRPSR